MGVGGPWRVSMGCMDELMDKNLPYFVGGNLATLLVFLAHSIDYRLHCVFFVNRVLLDYCSLRVYSSSESLVAILSPSLCSVCWYNDNKFSLASFDVTLND